MFETVIGIQGLSLDSTHTEPCAHRLSFWATDFRWVRYHSTSAQPNGKGGFAVSFYVRLWNATVCDSWSANSRRVRKLMWNQCLLVMQWHLRHPSLCLNSFLCQLVSNSQQHPSRVVTTSLCYRSEFPSLRTPMSRSRASSTTEWRGSLFR